MEVRATHLAPALSFSIKLEELLNNHPDLIS
jgi:hypothetical protein